MSIAEALQVKPYDCDYTVLELYQQAAQVFNSYADVKWTHLPLAGASIKFGSKVGCDYCSVRSVCMEAEGIAPF